MKKKLTEMTREPKTLSFRGLMFEALPEMWSFHFFVTIALGVPTMILNNLMTSVAEGGGSALTTANLGAFLLSWRGPALLALGVVFVLCYIVAELFAQICLTDDILSGRPAGIRRELARAARSLKRFLTPTGVLVALFIFLAVPLCGVGFSISLTSSFHIPNFIMDVVLARPYYALPYFALILLFLFLAYRYCFTLHAVLLDGMSCAEGRKLSARIMKKRGREFVFALIRLLFVLWLLQVTASLLLDFLPSILVTNLGAELPHDRVIDILPFLEAETRPTDLEINIMIYRVLAAFTVMLGGYLNSIVTLLCGAYFMLRFTRYYRSYASETVAERWPERPKKSRYLGKLFIMILVTVLVAAFSLILGLLYNQILDKEEPVRVIAHRTGGVMASENSVEGLRAAIEHGCYGSETDAQRTKDGYYIINHDNDFKRLTGTAKAPKDMTLAEIQELRIRDTAGSGAELPVPTLEELLDVAKGNIKLFIELKGATADRQMDGLFGVRVLDNA